MADEEGIQNTSPEETVVTEDQHDKANYHERIRNEPEFWVEEAKKKDSHIGKQNEELAKYKPLKPFIDAIGGDELARLAGIGNQIESNPHLKQVLQDAINGVAPKVSEEKPEEEIFDPEIKALKTQYDDRIAEQDNLIQGLKARLDSTEAQALKGSLSENMELALSKFSDDPELLKEAQGEISRAVASLEKASTNGDRGSFAQLQNLAGPNGSKTLRMMTLDTYDKLVTKQIEASAKSTNGEVIRSKATDAGTTTRAALPSDAIVIKSGAKITTSVVEAVMIKAAAKLGKDSRSLFG